MSVDQPTPLEVLAQLHALTLKDEAATIDLYAEDAVHELPFAPGGPARIEGRETLRQMMSSQGESPIRYEEFADVHIWETTDPEVVIAEYLIVGQNTATGERFRFPTLLILRARDGKITNTRSYFNTSEFAKLVNSAS